MDRRQLAELGVAWMQFWSDRRHLDGFEAIHAPSFIDRSPSGRGASLPAFRESVVELYAAFPDFSARITLMAVDEELAIVTIRWTATGTHMGQFMGVPPTEKVIAFEGIDIIRCVDDRVAERWGEWNGLEIFQAIGGFRG